jgi:hypothetical protein
VVCESAELDFQREKGIGNQDSLFFELLLKCLTGICLDIQKQLREHLSATLGAGASQRFGKNVFEAPLEEDDT